MAGEKIFISYRREDTSGESGRLKDKLEQVFGQKNIFYDVETLEVGLNFDESIAKALNESKVLLAMIGPHWLKVTDSKGEKRILKSNDWVRKEISQALKRGLRVIPILVNGADMPDPDELPEDLKELSLKHAQELTSSRWNYDVGELTKVLEKIISKRHTPDPVPDPKPIPRNFVPPVPQPKSWWAKNYLWALGGFVGFLLLIGMCVRDGDGYLPDENRNSPVDQADAIADQETTGTETYNRLTFGEKVPTLAGNWVLYLNGQMASNFVFAQNGAQVEFKEYNVFNEAIGEGSGSIENQGLVLDYYNSVVELNGTISISTINSGKSWAGTIYFPSTDGTGQVELRKD
jgi:hypothetical protein